MKIYYYRHPLGNVGDDLNAWLWPKIMPNLFDGFRYHGGHPDETDLTPIFIGIGTLLNEEVPKKCMKAIFGTGAGYGLPVEQTNAKYYAVRGPLTANKLNLNPKIAITDGAALIATIEKPVVKIRHKISLIPHHGSSEETNRWAVIADRLKINYIDPGKSPNQVISDILESELIITEAMHGAILADTLRVPWTAYTTDRNRHEFKWMDWCASLNLEHKPARLMPLYRVIDMRSTITNSIKEELNFTKLKKIIRSTKYNLSTDIVFRDRVAALQEKVEEFKYDMATGKYNF